MYAVCFFGQRPKCTNHSPRVLHHHRKGAEFVPHLCPPRPIFLDNGNQNQRSHGAAGTELLPRIPGSEQPPIPRQVRFSLVSIAQGVTSLKLYQATLGLGDFGAGRRCCCFEGGSGRISTLNFSLSDTVWRLLKLELQSRDVSFDV